MPVPRAIVCAICGGQFFKASLLHHQKVCAQKNAIPSKKCEFCETLVPALSLHNHYNIYCPNFPKNDSALNDVVDNDASRDGRQPCVFCGRFFARARKNEHEIACAKQRKDRPAFDSFRQRALPGAHRVTKPPKNINLSVTNSPETRMANAQPLTSRLQKQPTVSKESLGIEKSTKPRVPSTETRKPRQNPSDKASRYLSTNRDNFEPCLPKKLHGFAAKKAFPKQAANIVLPKSHNECDSTKQGRQAPGSGNPQIINTNITSPDNPLINQWQY